MVAVHKIGLLISCFSFVISFLSTYILLQCRTIRKEITKANDASLRWKPQKLETRPVSADNPRDEFFYLLQPWRVIRDMKNASFYCKNTGKHAKLVKMVVFIKSATTYGGRRMSIRNTWGKISHIENVALHVVFVVGMGTPDVQESLKTESDKFGDILQFIGVDDYRHIVYKVLAGMQWAKENLPRHYFYATADDDLLVNLVAFAKQLRMHMKRAAKKLPPKGPSTYLALLYHVPILCVFSYRELESPVRSMGDYFSKYYLDPTEFPMELFPPFCLGGWYMMPVERVVKLYEVSRTNHALFMDDVWITGILRLKIQPDSIEPIDTTAVKRGSRHVSHLWGDFKYDNNVTAMVYKTWGTVSKEIKTKKHCVRVYD